MLLLNMLMSVRNIIHVDVIRTMHDAQHPKIEYMHKRHYVHRDIKPDNFCLGAEDTVYLIDFGLAKKYRDSRTHEHMAFRTGFDEREQGVCIMP